MARRSAIPPVVAVVVAVVVAALLGAGAVALARSRSESGTTAGRPAGAADPSAAAKTSFPDLPAPSGELMPAGLEEAHPAPGTVVTVDGPFDDRFVLSDLRLRRGSVLGRLRVTSDVSDILELEVVAGFYDDEGGFLGTGRMTLHVDETTEAPHTGPPSEDVEVRVDPPQDAAGQVSAAAIVVPVLVNE